MLLNIDGFEVEIHRDSFVCVDDGATTRFCEWRDMDPTVQEKFSAFKSEVLVALEKFLTSDTKPVFDSIAEEYDNTINSCRGPSEHCLE